MKCSAFVGISLDGFVARTDGSIDFLTSDAWEQSENYGYSDFLASVDVLVWGRHTNVGQTRPEGWRYEGGGIYRHVWLNVTDPVYTNAIYRRSGILLRYSEPWLAERL